MPQLDKFTYYLQISTFLYSFFLFHYFFKRSILRSVHLVLKFREFYAWDVAFFGDLCWLKYHRFIFFCSLFFDYGLFVYLKGVSFLKSSLSIDIFNNFCSNEQKFFSSCYDYFLLKRDLFFFLENCIKNVK